MSVERARKLSRIMTPPEVALWQVLRLRPHGFQFRRQHPINPYVLDFYCKAAAVAVEVDGTAHDMGNNPERDGRRDAWLLGQGIKTLRYLASDVLKDVGAVVTDIVKECALMNRYGLLPAIHSHPGRMAT